LEPIEGAILAAGRGERLRAHGANLPKPLVLLDGETLLARQARILLEAGVSRVVAIINSETAGLMGRPEDAIADRLTLVVADTPNSMETLFQIGDHLSSRLFLAATVDAVFGPNQMMHFAQRARVLTGGEGEPGADGVLGVARWRGDERPLFVEADDRGAIRKVGGAAGTIVTAGAYFLPRSVFAFRRRAREAGMAALRAFLGGLVEWGVRFHAVELNEVIDIDRADDLEAARSLVARTRRSGNL
jgi:NDP-sugar pyrophosphorylase family protein